MTGAAAWGAGVSAPAIRGRAPAGRRWAASRRRPLALVVAFALGASVGGAALGLLKRPDPDDHFANLTFTATVAVETARRADERARQAEADLSLATSRIQSLSAIGAEQELADLREAERVGVSRFMKDATALWGDERRRVMAAIIREARRNGLDPALVAAVIQVESHFDPLAVSDAGAYGLMQVMPPTARWLLEKRSAPVKIRPAHLFNPVLNIELGTSYLAHLMSRFDGDLVRALIAYNAGPRIARSLQPGSRSWRKLHAYPRNVLAAYKSFLLVPEQLAAR